MTDLLKAFLDEGDGEHAILHTDPHELRWISTDIAKLDIVLNSQRQIETKQNRTLDEICHVWTGLVSQNGPGSHRYQVYKGKEARAQSPTHAFDPILVLAVRGDADLMSLRLESLAKSDV